MGHPHIKTRKSRRDDGENTLWYTALMLPLRVKLEEGFEFSLLYVWQMATIGSHGKDNACVTSSSPGSQGGTEGIFTSSLPMLV